MSFLCEHETLWPAAQAIALLPKPRTDAELELLMLLCFGRLGRLAKLMYGSYAAEAKFGDMFSKSFMEYHHTHSGCVRLYDYASDFWKRTIGPLHGGGIASVSYGHYTILSHRHKKRIDHWELSRRNNDSRTVRTPFARLARQLRDEKNREIRGIPVLLDSREDGMFRAFFATEATA